MPEQWNPFKEFYTPEFQQRDLYDRFIHFQEVFPNHPQFMDFSPGEREYIRNKTLNVENSDELYKHLHGSMKGADSTSRNRVFNSMMTDDPRWQQQWSIEDKTKIRNALVGPIDPAEQYAPPKGYDIPTRQLTPPTQEEAVAGLTGYAERQQARQAEREQQARQAESPIHGALDFPYVRDTLAPALSMIGQIPGQVAVQAGYTEAAMAPGEGTGAGRAVSPGFGREAFSLGAPPVQTEDEAAAVRAGVHGLALQFIEAGEKQQAAVAEHFPEPEVQKFEEIEGVGDALKYTLGVVSNMAGFVAQAAAGRAVGGPPGAVMAILPAVMSEASQEVRRITGDELRPDLVLPAAMASAALEYAGFATLSGAVTKNLRGKISARLVAGLMAAVQVSGVEGGTEWTQEFINLAVGRIADEDRKLFEKLSYEDRSRLANAAMAGVIGGLLMSGGGSAIRHQYLDGKQQADVDNAQGDIATIESLARTLVEHGPTGEQVKAGAEEMRESVSSELFEQPETGGAVVLDQFGQPVETGRPLEVTPEPAPRVRQEAAAQQPPVEGERRAQEGVPPPETLGQTGEDLEIPEQATAIMRERWNRAPEILSRGEFSTERTAFAEGRVAHLATTMQDDAAHGDNRLSAEDVRGLDEEMERVGAEIDAEFGIAPPAEPRVVKREAPPATSQLPETAGVIGGREFAERAIPQLEERIGELQGTLINSEALGQSDVYDGTYPIPAEGGLLAAKNTNRYKRDSTYKEKIDDAIGEVVDTMRMANRQRMTLLGTPGSGAFGVDYMVEKVKAGMTVPDPTLAWHREAQTKYSGADFLGDIGVREGLQNAVDATLESLSNREIEVGLVDIVIDGDEHGFTVMDNGIGMSDVDIRDKFLALHMTGKDKEGVVGGFGTGGAVLIAPTEDASWEIQTRDNIHDSAKAKEFAQVGTLDTPRQGTQIVVKADERIISEQALQFVETTEYPKNIKTTFNGQQVKNPFARRKYKETRAVVDDKTSLVIRYYPNAPEGYGHKQVLRIVEPRSGTRLTQGIERIWGDEFKGALIVDIETTETPGEYKYPLTNSRLSLKWGPAKDEVAGVIQEVSTDKLSARNVGGSTSYRLSDRKEWQRVLENVKTDEGYADLMKAINDVYEKTGSFFGHGGAPVTPLAELEVKIDTGYKGYRGASMAHAKHLAAYEAIARLVVSHARARLDNFYALLSNTVISEYNGGLGTLGLNFLKVDLTGLKSPLEYGMYLLDVIDHEFTHYSESQHNEEFTSAMIEIQKRTSPLFWDVLKIAEAAMGAPSEFISRIEHEATLEGERVKTQEAADARAKIAELLPAEQLELIYEDMEQPTIGGLDDHLYYPAGSGQEKAGRQFELYGGGVDRGDAGLAGTTEPPGARRGVQQPDTQGDVEAVEGRVGAGEQPRAREAAAATREPTGESAAATAREKSEREAARKRRLDSRGQHQVDIEREAERKEKRKVKAEARVETKAKAKKQAFIPDTVQAKILAAIKDDDLHTISEIEALTGIYTRDIRRNLKTLGAAGEINLGTQPTGRGDTDRLYAWLSEQAAPEDVAPTDVVAERQARKEKKEEVEEEVEATRETEYERVKREYEQAKTPHELELEDREKATQAGVLQIPTTEKQKERDAADFEETSDWRQRRWRDWFMRGGPLGRGRTTAGQQRALDRAGQRQEGGTKLAQADRRLIDDHVRRLTDTRHDRARTGEVLTQFLTGTITDQETANILKISVEDKAIVDLGKKRAENSARSEEIKGSEHVPIDIAAKWENTFYFRLAYARFLMEANFLGRWRRFKPTEVDKKLATDTVEAAFAREIEQVSKRTQTQALELPSSFDMVAFLSDTKHKNTQHMLEDLNNVDLARKLELLREEVQHWKGALEFENSIDLQGVRMIRHADGLREHAEGAIEILLNPREKLEGGGLLKSTYNLEARTLTEVFKQLYGEIKDPGVLQALTVETQSNILAQAQFFEDMLANGEDLVWTRRRNDTVLTEKMGSVENDSDVFKYGPLAGTYVTKEFKDYIDGKGRVHAGLRDLLNLANPDNSVAGAILGGAFSKVQAFTRKMALMTLGTWNRNAISSVLSFALSSGDAFHPKFALEFTKAIPTVLRAWVGNERGMRQLAKDMEAGAFNYTQSSIVADFKPAAGPTAQRIWQGANPLMGALRTVKNLGRKSSELYVLLDYMAKKAAFNLRRDLAMERMKNVPDMEQKKELAEQHAREHVGKFYQNNDRVPAAVKALGVTGADDFVSFKYDSGRITTNALINAAVCSTPLGRKPSPEGSVLAKWKGVANEHPEILDTWEPAAGFSAARFYDVMHGLWGPGQYKLAFGGATAAISVKGIKMVLVMTGAIKPGDEPEEEITEITPELMAGVNEMSPSYDANATKWAAQAEDEDGKKSIIVVPLNNQMASMPEDTMLGFAQRINSGGETIEEIAESMLRQENVGNFMGMAWSNIWEAATGHDPQTQFRQESILQAWKDFDNGMTDDGLDELKGAFINFIADSTGGFGRSYKQLQVREQKAGRTPEKGVTGKRYDEETTADYLWGIAKPLVRLLRIKKWDDEEVLRVIPYKLGSSAGRVWGSRANAREDVKNMKKWVGDEATNEEIARSGAAMENYVGGLRDAENRMAKMMPLIEHVGLSKETVIAQLSDKSPLDQKLTKAEAEAVVYGKVDEYLASDDMYEPEAKPTRLMKGDDFIRDMLIEDSFATADDIIAMMKAEGYDIEKMYASEKYTAESRVMIKIRTFRDEIIEKKATTTLYD